jgi:hypothetical protein
MQQLRRTGRVTLPSGAPSAPLHAPGSHRGCRGRNMAAARRTAARATSVPTFRAGRRQVCFACAVVAWIGPMASGSYAATPPRPAARAALGRCPGLMRVRGGTCPSRLLCKRGEHRNFGVLNRTLTWSCWLHTGGSGGRGRQAAPSAPAAAAHDLPTSPPALPLSTGHPCLHTRLTVHTLLAHVAAPSPQDWPPLRLHAGQNAAAAAA